MYPVVPDQQMLPGDFNPVVNQLSEYISYKDILESTNFTYKFNSPYNFTGAREIIEEFENSFYTYTNYTTVVLLTIYVPVILFGLIGNLLVLLVVLSDKKLKSAKNYYLLNLVVSDLCVIVFCIPISIGTIVYRLWFYGAFLCKFTAFFQGVVVASSIFTLTAMGIDRYSSIQHPVTTNWVTSPNQAITIIIAIWMVSAIFMGPIIYIREIDKLEIPLISTMQFCIENWPRDEDRRSYGVFLLAVVYIIPGGTLSICYAQVSQTLCTNEFLQENSGGSSNQRLSRIRAAKVLVVLVIVFILFWLPYNIISLCIDLTHKITEVSALSFALWFGHAHSAANPVIYWTLSRQFRDKLRRMVHIIQRSNGFLNTPTPEFM